MLIGPSASSLTPPGSNACKSLASVCLFSYDIFSRLWCQKMQTLRISQMSHLPDQANQLAAIGIVYHSIGLTNHKDRGIKLINHKVWQTPPHPPGGGCLIRREDLVYPFLASPAAALPRFWPVLALLLTCLALPPPLRTPPVLFELIKSSDTMSSVNPRPLWFIVE